MLRTLRLWSADSDWTETAKVWRRVPVPSAFIVVTVEEDLMT